MLAILTLLWFASLAFLLHFFYFYLLGSKHLISILVLVSHYYLGIIVHHLMGILKHARKTDERFYLT